MVETVVVMLVGVGLSLLAGYLLQQRNKNLAQDDKPTTLVQRGAYLPRVIGIRRVGPIFAFAGLRSTNKERRGGKDEDYWAGRQKVRVYNEVGWHLLCLGPAKALHEIDQNGEVIFIGPITRDTHPSGSGINLGKEGTFFIYWGENDQPVNTQLGQENHLGVSSRWPGCCYILWSKKRLGEQPLWPVMTYVIECEPSETHLTETEPYIPATQVLLEQPEYPIANIVQNALVQENTTYFALNIDATTPGVSGVGKLTFDGDLTAIFAPLNRFRLEDNSNVSDRDLNVFYSETRQVQSGTRVSNFISVPLFRIVTDVYFFEELPIGFTSDGKLLPYERQPDDGYNPAHIIADLLFSRWPNGVGLDKSLFDMDSLEALGVLAEEEDLRCSVIAKEGQDLRGLLAGILQDLGCMLPINFRTGLLEFVPVRAPSGTVVNLPGDVLTQLPETEIVHGPRAVDRLVWQFPDRKNRFRDMTIHVDDSGQATFAEFFRQRVVQIISTTDYATAARISERRSQEELSGGGEIKLEANRGARNLLPGQALTADGVPEVLRVSSVEADPLSGNVTLACVTDFYGVRRSDFQQPPGDTGPTLLPVQADPIVVVLELPEAALLGRPQTVQVLRIRAHEQIAGANLLISRDDTTYVDGAEDTSVMQGGVLEATMEANDLFNQAEGPVIVASGPDAMSALDLSADEVSWRNGRQLVLIDEELFYLKKLTSLGSGRYRMDGLIRARFDTRAVQHAAGSPVVIFQDDDGEPIQDALLEPQVELYVKSQPYGNGVVPITNIPPVVVQLYGKGIRPVPVRGICFDLSAEGANPYTRLSWASGDLPIRWAYSTPQSPNTGAGMFGAGNPQSDAEPEGDFLVQVMDGSTVVRELTVTTPTWTYTEAARTADWSGEPTSFVVRVTQLRAGLSSDPTSQTFTRAA
jgi:hypothetical protein